MIGKALLLPNVFQGIGAAASGLTTELGWHPDVPFISATTGDSGRAIAGAWTTETGKPWIQTLGLKHGLIDLGLAALRGATDAADPGSIVTAIRTLDVETTLGRANFGASPIPNVAKTDNLVAYDGRPRGNAGNHRMQPRNIQNLIGDGQPRLTAQDPDLIASPARVIRGNSRIDQRFQDPVCTGSRRIEILRDQAQRRREFLAGMGDPLKDGRRAMNTLRSVLHDPASDQKPAPSPYGQMTPYKLSGGAERRPIPLEHHRTGIEDHHPRRAFAGEPLALLGQQKPDPEMPAGRNHLSGHAFDDDRGDARTRMGMAPVSPDPCLQSGSGPGSTVRRS